ncbi:hypothetical protein [Sedimentitalea sp.]|uniref:hypothetical protein n=1 Tax=Sedimentitalea sp. TaxID=2048915 RepID=UPI003299483F
MTHADDTIRVLIPLNVRKKNGRPKILPPADYLPSEDQTQHPHVLRAIGRAWGWRRRMDTGEFSTIQELAGFHANQRATPSTKVIWKLNAGL